MQNTKEQKAVWLMYQLHEIVLIWVFCHPKYTVTINSCYYNIQIIYLWDLHRKKLFCFTLNYLFKNLRKKILENKINEWLRAFMA